jgi:poly(A) polymerase
VAPKHVKREDFFEDMYEALKARPEVSEIAGVSDAYVPVIKLVFSSIPIDLVFARLSLPSVPDSLSLLDNSLLRNLDERCVRSLNGSRVTDEMLRLVPNVESFRIALRCIKLWAKKRAIYANVFGFFGGVAWALAVARVCQLYPNASASTIVSKFFRIMQQWAWPQPVLLKPIEEANLGLRTWNPKIYPQDRGHRMPIITPAYPSMCATHNVTSSTQKVKLREFERAADLTDRVMIGKGHWSELFEKHDFFTRYKYYLQVIASSNSADTQLLWSGMVESRLRQLVMKLEMVEDIELAHPFIKGYDRVVKCKTEQEKHDAAHGVFLGHSEDAKVDVPSTDLASSSESLAAPPTNSSESDKNGTTKIESAEDPNSTSVYITCLYIGLSVKKKDPSAGPRKLDISWPIQEFTRLVKGWEKFDETAMAIVVRYIKRFV